SGAAACLVSLARATGPLYPYLTRFVRPVTAVVWLAVARAVAPALASIVAALWHAQEHERSSRVLKTAPLIVAGLIVLVLAVAMVGPAVRAEPPDSAESANLGRMVDATVPRLTGLANGGTILVHPEDDEINFPAPNTRGEAAGLVSVLRKQG